MIKAFKLLAVLLFCASTHAAQKQTVSFCIEFRVNSKEIDSAFGNNAENLRQLEQFIQSVKNDTATIFQSAVFNASASPEGSREANEKLAFARFESLDRYVRSRMEIPEGLHTERDICPFPWSEVASQLESSDIAYKDEILDIINASPESPDIKKLKTLRGGKAWRMLNEHFFRHMRNACVVFITFHEEPPEPEPIVVEEPIAVEPEPEPIVEEEPAIVEPGPVIAEEPAPVAEKTRHWYLKTNAVGWALFVSNLAIEVDFGKRWSFTLPIYYSGINYFTRTLKFRTFTMQPEIRYWFAENDGFFVGAHAGLGYYNYALNGDYRIQDRDADTPSIGGGISVGYRMPLGKSKRWKMEFTLGAGIYPARYDKFKNERNGALVSTHKTTFYGIDNAAVSFVYTFDRKNKRK